MSDKYYWWCSECKRKVDGKEVTFSEYHENCGYHVVAISNMQDLISREDVVEMLEKLNQEDEINDKSDIGRKIIRQSLLFQMQHKIKSMPEVEK